MLRIPRTLLPEFDAFKTMTARSENPCWKQIYYDTESEWLWCYCDTLGTLFMAKKSDPFIKQFLPKESSGMRRIEDFFEATEKEPPMALQDLYRAYDKKALRRYKAEFTLSEIAVELKHITFGKVSIKMMKPFYDMYFPIIQVRSNSLRLAVPTQYELILGYRALQYYRIPKNLPEVSRIIPIV